MKQRVLLTSVLFLLCMSVAVGQDQVATEHYDVDEAYKVYSVLLPSIDRFNPAKGAMIIQEETIKPDVVPSECLPEEEAKVFKDAIADYERANKSQWLLERRFDTKKPYDLVNSRLIKDSFRQPGNWSGFYARYPSSGGVIHFSAVGFNGDKTQAVVYSGINCGGMCASFALHLLKKTNGTWKDSEDTHCWMMS